MLSSSTSHTGYFLPSGYTNKVASMRVKCVNYTDCHVCLEYKKTEFSTCHSYMPFPFMETLKHCIKIECKTPSNGYHFSTRKWHSG